MEEEIIGDAVYNFPCKRRSWLWLFTEIIQPAAMNKSALNVAWVDMWKMGEWVIILFNRYEINTPAVTKVDKCTSADTGVGAAIVVGS